MMIPQSPTPRDFYEAHKRSARGIAATEPERKADHRAHVAGCATCTDYEADRA